MKLASILSPGLILCRVAADSRINVYRRLLKTAAGRLATPINVEATLDAMLEREAVTHMPYEGVAFPHLLLPELNDLYVVVGLLDKPMKFKDYDAAPSRVVVMSLISENTVATYLRSTSAFVRYLSSPDRLARFADSWTPEAALELLQRDDVQLRKTLTADDLVDRNWPCVRPGDALALALDACSGSDRAQIPVVDDERKLLGVIDATEVIKSFIPDYIFMMDNLNFLSSLEVFEKIFNAENHHLVRDYMLPAVTIAPETPLIQFTVRLARRETPAVFVADADGRLVGGINIKDVVRRVLRG